MPLDLPANGRAGRRYESLALLVSLLTVVKCANYMMSDMWVIITNLFFNPDSSSNLL